MASASENLTVICVVLLGLWLLISPRRRKPFRRRGSRYIPGDYVVRERRGRRVFEHREVAERVLGRRLTPNEVVHHINGRKGDNRPENLCVMRRRAHDAYHAWYDSVYRNFKVRPRRTTQLKVLESRYGGILLKRE